MVSWLHNTRQFVSVLLFWMMALAASGAAAQPIITDFQDRASKRAVEELTRQDGELYVSDQAERLRRTPLIVFIPGIMGSKIEECGGTANAPTDCKFIWGQKNWSESLAHANLSIKPGMIYRTDVLDNFHALGQDVEFYGPGLAFVNGQYISSHPSLVAFPYDWRQDNRLSALGLNEFLCKLAPVQRNRPVIFAAHSMGGLVLKYWFGNVYGKRACASGEQLALKVDEVMFIGTPHYGAPEAIKVFAEGFKLQGSSGIFGMIKNCIAG